MKRAILTLLTIVGLTAVGVFAGLAAAAEAPRMTVEELKSKLGSPDVAILDVRSEADWKDSEQKIQGAVRESPREIKSWAGKYAKEKTLVLYCA